jgi:hypothetical protein
VDGITIEVMEFSEMAGGMLSREMSTDGRNRPVLN